MQQKRSSVSSLLEADFSIIYRKMKGIEKEIKKV